MNLILRFPVVISIIVAAFFSAPDAAQAATPPVEVKAVRKRVEDEKKLKDGTARDSEGKAVPFSSKVRQQRVVYAFTVTNRSFQDLDALTVKYQIFYEDVKAGSASKPDVKSVAGSTTTPALKRSGDQATVESNPVKLDSSELPPNIEYTSGAANRAKDRVIGVWVRVYDAAGTLLVDQPNPTTLKQKHEWKE